MDSTLKDAITSELEWSFARSSGPGGQHVNTTDSKVQMKWNFQTSSAISLRQKKLIETRLHNYIRKTFFLHLSDSTNRSREMNRKTCLKKLFHLLDDVAFKKIKPRLKTRPTKGSVERRLKSKKNKSDVKKNRGRVKY